MSRTVTRSAVLKIEEVKPLELHQLHLLEQSARGGGIKVVSSELGSANGTYTVKVMLPITGHTGEYASSWQSQLALPMSVFEALGIFPSSK